jgi:hypothetical protein
MQGHIKSMFKPNQMWYCSSIDKALLYSFPLQVPANANSSHIAKRAALPILRTCNATPPISTRESHGIVL